MAKRWQQRTRRNQRWKFKNKNQKKEEFLLLDQFSVGDIRKWKALQEKILKLHWDYCSSLSYQRSKLTDKIRQSLLYASERCFVIKNWQRAVKYRYALEPLSVTGSLTDPGGRFNIGEINPQAFSPFAALYIASDKETALQELLSQKIETGKEATALDSALANPSSIVAASISGYLDSVINLREPEELEPFIDLLKNFTIPEHVKEVAKDIGLSEPHVIKTVPQMIDAFLDPNWRSWPMHFDVPVASQFFGQMVLDAGIHGILYPSKYTNKDNLVIFPQNFGDSPSYVSLDGELPPGVKAARLDSDSVKE